MSMALTQLEHTMETAIYSLNESMCITMRQQVNIALLSAVNGFNDFVSEV